MSHRSWPRDDIGLVSILHVDDEPDQRHDERPPPEAVEIIDDAAFRVAGTGSLGCLRIALHRPPSADRTALVDTTARMLAAALAPPEPS